MGDSRSFGAQVPQKGHLVRGSGGIAGEVADLRSDVDDGFLEMESEVAGPSQSQASLLLDTLATAADTVTIGADIYEYLALLTDAVTTPGNIGVLHGVDAAATLANIIEAINGTGVASGVSAGHGTESVLANAYNTNYLHIDKSAFPGGPEVPGDGPNVALAASLTSGDVWDHLNLSATGWDGGLKKQLIRVVVDATNLAAAFDLAVGFTPLLASVVLVTDAAGVPDGTGKGSDLPITLVPARLAVTVDLDGGTVDPVATDIVYIEVQGLPVP
jgi:hypothetical protein